MLTDMQQRPTSQPTKKQILLSMHWLVKDSRAGDHLLFYYCGMYLLTRWPVLLS
ncbi:Metacaspase-1B [Fusarium odoratissimum]|uniref:Metacaspase-1B n=1 Tax=Fusarium oxysporum f. sp. cubense (strain race 4) TaxID=2502994 RepID=N1S8H5_FUSC4|nr:Metacaspase-1B [Fusarium odoratissimum]